VAILNRDLSHQNELSRPRRWAVGRFFERLFLPQQAQLASSPGQVHARPPNPLKSVRRYLGGNRRLPSRYHHRFNAAQWPCLIELQGDNVKALQTLAARCMAETRRLEEKFSPFGLESVVRKINQTAGQQPVAVDAETEQLFDLAHAQWVASEGQIDPTACIARYAWGPSLDQPHSASELQHLVECIGWHRVAREPGWVRFDHPALELNFGVLLEAFVADRIADMVSAHGAIFGRVEIANVMRVFGAPAAAAPVATPASASATALPPDLLQVWPVQTGAVVALHHRNLHPLQAVSQPERPDGLEGPAHLIYNPKTGQPLTHWKVIAVQAPTAVAGSELALQGATKEGGAVAWLNAQAATFLALRCDEKAFCSDLDLLTLLASFL
jgi:FAD:protein FMN transferase